MCGQCGTGQNCRDRLVTSVLIHKWLNHCKKRMDHGKHQAHAKSANAGGPVVTEAYQRIIIFIYSYIPQILSSWRPEYLFCKGWRMLGGKQITQR